ncbi:MAG: glycoside hydrolase family 16 protein [Bacteroidota bacterium]
MLTQQLDSVHANEWELIWKDEFTFFDTSKWVKINAPSGINNEQQLYTPENIYIENGRLVIDAKVQEKLGRNYTSGKISSRNKFHLKYGRVELRLKTAATFGTQTVFWLLHDACDGVHPCIGNWPPEIDVIEVLGKVPDEVHQVIHYSTSKKGRWPNWDFSSTITPLSAAASPSSSFHTYAMEWDTNTVRWYIDDRLTKTWTANNENSFSPDESMFLIFNIAVGGDWAGLPNEQAIWPQQAYLDWVRVYKKKRAAPPKMAQNFSTIFYIQNMETGYYLTANKLIDGSYSIVQAALGNNWSNQKWRINHINKEWCTLHPVFKEELVVSLGIQSESPALLSKYKNLDHQKWKVIVVEGKARFASKQYNDLFLSTNGHENWSPVVLKHMEQGTFGRWYLEPIKTLEKIN